ncbi:hypothetical protein LP109_05420 [Moraxella bovis]|uniref:hypothetical protein n=1 Tax=Moraxella bovis TaxID=476 RepID=UPI00099408C1|nr:hypothetical protein [Moraxella bovis]OOR87085.1 hypothetical protein B0182_13235 [Moraxella bovis]UZA17722.1 hypothetical protein LP109_05420 [Moraxella bovis]
MALNDDDKYKKPELTAGDVALGSAIPAYGGLKWAGGGSALQGAKTVGKGAWDTTRAMGRVAGGMAQQAGGVKGLASGAKALGGATARVAPAVFAGVQTAMTDTEDYYERFGLDKSQVGNSFWKDVGVRSLGFASDLGDALTLGQVGKYLYRDKIRQNNEQQAQQAQQAQPAQDKTPTNEQTNATKQQLDDGYELKKINPPRQTSYHFDYGNKPASQQSQQSQQPQATIPTGGIPSHNQSYTDLVKKVQEAQQQALDKPQENLGLRTHAPVRSWENEAQRKELLRQATTVHKGAHGLTANQLRLAHELSNDDIKMEQERHLQQNNLNHQLLQTQLQQEGQNARTLASEQGANARTLASEQGANARAVMNEQGQNNRFNTGFGLDVARFNQDTANKQHEFGLRGMELNAKLKSQSYDDAVKQELNSLYHNYGLAQTDEEKQALYDKLGFLTGKGGQQSSGGSLKDNFIVMTDKDGNNKLVDLRTMQGGQAQKQLNLDDPATVTRLQEIAKKGGTADEVKKALLAEGVPEEYIAQLMGVQQ